MGTTKAKKPVVVFTDKRGVFFGYLNGAYSREKLTLKNARMCVYWTAEVHGALGLASTGPTSACKVTLPVPELELVDIHGIAKCTDDAVEAWEKGPWAR